MSAERTSDRLEQLGCWFRPTSAELTDLLIRPESSDECSVNLRMVVLACCFTGPICYSRDRLVRFANFSLLPALHRNARVALDVDGVVQSRPTLTTQPLAQDNLMNL